MGNEKKKLFCITTGEVLAGSKAHSDDQGDGVWVLPQETSRAGEGFLALGYGTKTQVLSGCHHLLPSNSSILPWAWGPLGGSWLDTELEFGISIFSKEVLPSILKWFCTPSVICGEW